MKFQTWLYYHGDDELVRLDVDPMTAWQCNQFRRILRHKDTYDVVPLFWPVDQPVPEFLARHLVEREPESPIVEATEVTVLGIA